ncbi:MAG: Ldh family oxidoreductase [Cyclobacteriaceae bacterium]|jgi:L-2-hydroxycarboxylate dehydrogenase (NAD+)|nr:malate dehydrogenase [Flammeovirgaceae bacterium]MDG1106623.1 Ldh family oxidoreductase [Cyclobacteriaceae bacterium]
MTKYSFDRLHLFTVNLFMKIGCPNDQAIEAANVLLSADLRGVDSHGVARLVGYLRLYEKNRINSKPQLSVVHETPSTAVVDGDAGLGLVAGPYAMRLAIEKAKNVGTGWIAVKNSNHYGIAGYHAMMALEADCIGISMTNASPLVAPTYSKERLLGTNPIAVAVPAGNEPPFVADMATTTAANGKLEILQRKNESAPLGWLQDKEGQPTQAAQGIVEGGALLPLGGDREHGSHKGFILGSIVDILSAVLSGANFGPWVPPFVSFLDPDPNPVGAGIGHFFGALRIDAFRPASEFKTHMDIWIKRFRNAVTINETNKVIIPGDPERQMDQLRRKEGIPLLDTVVKDLQSLSEQYQVKF